MDTTYANVAGLDVHHKSIQVAVRCLAPSGKLLASARSFGTMTSQLRALADYMAAQGVTHVALESTGVLWKPVWNILEGRFTLLLVNPRHLKKVPGRKTDVSDAAWIAQLLQHGLLKGSFVPCRTLRDLRDVTRQRAQLAGETTRVVNRLHKLLQDTNIKLDAVASNILGVSGRRMLHSLLAGETDPRQLAELAQGKLRAKIPELQLALEGRFTEHHRFVLKSLLTHLELLEHETEALTHEIGPDMDVFPDEHHLRSWTGICPGNEESAGKRLRSGTRHGNRWLRRALTEAAWAATHAKDSYFAAQYRRLAARRGKKRALLAVAHSILIVIYHVLKHHTEYHDLGRDYFDRLNPEHLTRYLVKRLESLGHEVFLQPRKPNTDTE